MEIYAELSKEQYRSIIKGECEICVPYGVSIKNKKGSRAIFFNCDSDNDAKELIEGLENSGITWQNIDDWEKK